MSKVFRCTRNEPYQAPSCPGRVDLTARQGYYIEARNLMEAVEDMTYRFPADVIKYGSPTAAFTVEEQ